MEHKVKFGIRVSDFPFHEQTGIAFWQQVEAYLEAFRGKFDSAWVADHFVPWHTETDQSRPVFEAWSELAYLAGKMPEYTFGNLVLSQSYRPPALLAKMAASLQLISGGRLVLGIGAGWKEDEYRAYGYEFPDAATRIHQLDEAVQIIRLMWREPKATFQGKYYQIQEAICEPKPNPLPPIMIGGSGKKLTLRVVAKYADWSNFVGVSAEKYAELLEVLRGHCQAVGRDFDKIEKTYSTDCVAVADSHSEAERIAKVSALFNPDSAIFGMPDEVATQLRRFVDLGVTHFILRFADFPKLECAAKFYKEVVPLLSK
jgi:F420-dependent oxidoreductase-like protein